MLGIKWAEGTVGSSTAHRAWGDLRPLVPHCLGWSHSSTLARPLAHAQLPKISGFRVVGSQVLQEQTLGSALVEVMH